MKIELFMENPTDSFYQPLQASANLVCARLGAKTAYAPTSSHSFMHSGADGTLELPDGKHEVKLSIRQEDDGALLLNRATGRIYRLDDQALCVVEKLVAGQAPMRVAGEFGVDLQVVQQAVAILKSS